jgi:uncharacterized lipoprotein YmbA
MTLRLENIYVVVMQFFLLFALTGCFGHSPPSNHYLLAAVESPVGANELSKADQPLRLCIGPIVFPKYLDRPQMVFRQDDHKVKISQFDRWAEPLPDSFKRVLIENLSRLLNTDDVYPFPLTRRQVVDYRVGVTIYRFDAAPGKNAELTATWSVYSEKDQSLLFNRKTIIQKTINHGDTPAMVATLNDMVTEFSREIATTLSDPESGVRSVE